MSLRVSTQEIGGHMVLVFDGALDMSSVPQLTDALTRHVRPTGTIVLDLDEITVLDDTAIGILLGAAARQRESGGMLGIVCTNPAIVDRLRRSGVGAAIPVGSSVHDITSP